MSSTSNTAVQYGRPERRKRRLSAQWLLLACGVAGVIVFATLCPLHWRPRLSHNPNIERFAAFLLLGFAAKLAFPRRHVLTVLGVIALAAGLEAAQLLIPGRDARVMDAVVKATGAVMGVQFGLVSFMFKRAVVRLATFRTEKSVSVHA